MELVKYLSRLGKDDVYSIGQFAHGLATLLNEGIPIPPSFVLTRDALPYFLDFTGIKGQLTNTLNGKAINFRRMERSILDAAMPPILSSALDEAYKRISGFIEGYAVVKPYLFTEEGSWPIDQTKQRIILGSDALSKAVRRIWAETLIQSSELLQKIATGSINVGLLVQKLPLEEVSGKLTTSDLVTKGKEHLWIEAVYGMWEITEKEGVVPDQYIYSRKENKPIDKHVSKQPSMLIRQLYKDMPSLEKIPVSSIWQTMPKLNDKYVDHLAKIGMTIEEFYRVPCEIDWVYEAGKLWVIGIDPLEKAAVRSVTEAEGKQVQATVRSSDRSQPLPKKPKMWAKTIKTKEVVVRGIGNGEGYIEAVATKTISKGKPTPKSTVKLALVVADTGFLEDHVLNSFAGIVLDRGKRGDSSITRTQMLGIPMVFDTAIATRAIREGDKIWIDGVKGVVYRARPPKFKSSQTAFSTTAKRSLDKVKYDRTATKLLVEYGKISQTDALQSDNTSALTDGMVFTAKASFDGPLVELVNAFHLQGKPALACIETTSWLEPMAKEIYSARTQKSLKGIWMVMPPYSDLEEIREAKHLLLDIGLRRSSTFKLFGSIKRPSQLFGGDAYFDIGFDGVFIDIPALQHSLSGRVLNKVTAETLKPLTEFCRAASKKGVETYFRLGELKLLKTGVEVLVRAGAYAISTSEPSYFPKLRNLIGEVEHALITKS